MNQSQQLLPLKLLILLMATAAIFLLISNRVQASVPTRDPVPHRVVHGESLWEIAAALESDQDVRAIVGEIQRINELSGATIHPGQTLLLPAT